MKDLIARAIMTYGLFGGTGYLLTETLYGTVAGIVTACFIQYCGEVVNEYKRGERRK